MATVSDALRSLTWLPAREMVAYHSLCLIKRMLVTGAPEDIAKRLSTVGQGRERSTRKDADLTLPSLCLAA